MLRISKFLKILRIKKNEIVKNLKISKLQMFKFRSLNFISIWNFKIKFWLLQGVIVLFNFFLIPKNSFFEV